MDVPAGWYLGLGGLFAELGAVQQAPVLCWMVA
jgi:hypothetical protein